MRIPRALTLAPLAFLVIFGVAPLALLTVASFFPEGSPSLAAHRHLLPSGGSYPLLVNSLALAACSAFLATTLGIVPGVAIGRTDLRRKPAWCILFALPLLLPPLFAAAGWRPWAGDWLALAGPGLLSRFAGACLVTTLVTFPIPLFLIALSVRRTDAALEDVTLLHGGPRRALRATVFTLARPGVSLAWLLVFLISLSEKSLPGLFAFPTYQTRVAEVALEGGWRFAGAASFPLILAALAIAAAEARLFGERGVSFLARGTRPTTLHFGLSRRGSAVVQLVLGALAALALGAPLAGWTLALQSGGESGSALVLASAWHSGGPAFGRSLVFALAGGSLAAALGIPLAYAAERGSPAGRRVLDLLLVLLFVVPGTVLASGILRLVPSDLFRASAAALLAGYGVHLAVAPCRMERVALRQLGTSGEDAGMLAGARWRLRVERLVLPLNADYLAAVWAAAVLLAFRDGELAAALSPAAPTLAALGEAAGRESPAALGALALVAAGLAAFTLVTTAVTALLFRAGRQAPARLGLAAVRPTR